MIYGAVLGYGYQRAQIYWNKRRKWNRVHAGILGGITAFLMILGTWVVIDVSPILLVVLASVLAIQAFAIAFALYPHGSMKDD